MNNIIVVPIDGSPSAYQALTFAIEAAKQSDDRLILLNVQHKYIELQEEHILEEVEIKMLQEKKGLAVMQEGINIVKEKGISFETVVRVGIATIEITSEAKQRNARMIVLGSRGNGPVVNQVLGSVTYGVLHLATCPVTIVPASTEH